MNHHVTVISAIVVLASSAAVTHAGKQSCADKALQLRAQVDTLPAAGRARLSRALLNAASADSPRCEQMIGDVEQALSVASEGHASAGKPIPNFPSSPAEAQGGPGFSDHSSATDRSTEEGHASPDAPIPSQGSNSSSAHGPSQTNGSATSADGSTVPGHASSEEPIPNRSNSSED